MGNECCSVEPERVQEKVVFRFLKSGTVIKNYFNFVQERQPKGAMPIDEPQAVEHVVVELPGEEKDYEEVQVDNKTYFVIKEEKYTEYAKSKYL